MAGAAGLVKAAFVLWRCSQRVTWASSWEQSGDPARELTSAPASCRASQANWAGRGLSPGLSGEERAQPGCPAAAWSLAAGARVTLLRGLGVSGPWGCAAMEPGLAEARPGARCPRPAERRLCPAPSLGLRVEPAQDQWGRSPRCVGLGALRADSQLPGA